MFSETELLHHDYVFFLLTEICFGDPGYEEFEPAEGWRPFGVMRRKRAPFRWEFVLAEHFPVLSWWYSRLAHIDPDPSHGGTMRQGFNDLAEMERNKGIRLDESWDQEVCSFLRKICNQAFKVGDYPLCPGNVSSKHKSHGKILPAGYMNGYQWSMV